MYFIWDADERRGLLRDRMRRTGRSSGLALKAGARCEVHLKFLWHTIGSHLVPGKLTSINTDLPRQMGWPGRAWVSLFTDCGWGQDTAVGLTCSVVPLPAPPRNGCDSAKSSVHVLGPLKPST